MISGIAWLCSMLGVYLEYRAHGDLAAERDPKLAKKWMLLFAATLAFTLLGSAASYGVLWLYLQGVMSQINWFASVVNGLQLILNLLYLWCLYRTIPLAK